MLTPCVVDSVMIDVPGFPEPKEARIAIPANSIVEIRVTGSADQSKQDFARAAKLMLMLSAPHRLEKLEGNHEDHTGPGTGIPTG